jgi:hypothetical protein
MARRIGITIVWAVLFGCPLLAPAHARAAVTSADLSTPAKALAAFCKALGNGETADLAVVSVGDAKVQDWVCAEAGQLKALKDLETALSNRFGANYAASDKGKEALDRIAEARDDDLHTDLANAPLREIKGDEVILEIDEAKPEDHQGRRPWRAMSPRVSSQRLTTRLTQSMNGSPPPSTRRCRTRRRRRKSRRGEHGHAKRRVRGEWDVNALGTEAG